MTDLICYSVPAQHVARITLARPAKRNAQNVRLLYQLNDAFDRAARDEDVRVIIVDAEGDHFSAGHDVKDPGWPDAQHLVSTWCHFSEPTVPGWISREMEIYHDLCLRWRDLPKPTIAAVHGLCIGGGLMLAWVCDLIVAAEDAEFSDPVVGLGVNGVEWFVHAWELGARKAKEVLLTGDSWTAAQAERLGMVNLVVPREELARAALGLAVRIAAKPPFAARMAKLSVNESLNAQGQLTAVRSAFMHHQLGHAHNWAEHGLPVDPAGLGPSVKISTFATYQDHLAQTEAREQG